MREVTRRTLLRTVGGGLGLTTVGAATATPTDIIGDESFPSRATIDDWHDTTASFLPRPTASPTAHAYVDWLQAELEAIPGIRRGAIDVHETDIDRWIERDASLRVRAGPGRPIDVPLARSVPYTESTGPRGVRAPLTYVPPETALSEADIEGKLVVREVLPESVPIAAFYANAYYVHDPDASINPANDYERDWLALGELDAELDEAARAGAAGVLYVLEFPREQVEGYYRPFQAIRHGVSGVFLGVDEGTRLIELAQRETDVTGRLRLTADEQIAPARTLTATLPGRSDEKIIINTHTDGENVIEENGPIALLTLARYFARRPAEARARTLEFVFHAGHFYGDVPIEAYAEEVDEAYEEGKVALVATLEHLGGREYEATGRDGDTPGRQLRQTGLNELTGVFVPQSPALAEAVSESVAAYDLRRTVVLRGASLPTATTPPFGFAGPGQDFHKRSIPTVALICGPWTLLSGAYGVEAVDTGLFRSQAMAAADFIETVSTLPRAAIAGSHTVYRAGEEAGLDPKGSPADPPDAP